MEPMVNIALRAARRAGQIIVRALDRADLLQVESKGAHDYVTDIDRQAEAAIVDVIRKAYPDHAVLGEEFGAHGDDDEYVWIVDPLDGTTNFLQGIPHFSTSIGIRRGATLLHGVIVDPIRHEEFTASRGSGARMNGQRLRVTSTAKIDDALLASDLVFAKTARHQPFYLDALGTLLPKCKGVRHQGSAALDLAYVAAGRFDGFFEIGLKPWDMAAGAVIVREAGGFVSDIAGGDRFMETGNVVAATPKVSRELLKTLRQSAQATADSVMQRG